MSESRDERDAERIADYYSPWEIDQAVILHLAESGIVDRDHVADMETALAASRLVGTAMGILMAREALTEPQAFDRLREASQQTDRKVLEVAEDVLYNGLARPEH